MADMQNNQKSGSQHTGVIIAGILAVALLVLDFFFPRFYFNLGVILVVAFLIISHIRAVTVSEKFTAFIGRVIQGDPGRIPTELPPKLLSLARETEAFFLESQSTSRGSVSKTSRLQELISSSQSAIGSAFTSAKEKQEIVEQAILLSKETDISIKKIASLVETLATSAEESSSSILEMTTTNEEVAENMVTMGNSVRETVSSITEMAHSTKEVAKNIDALSETAETTSTAVNEMDVSIDQVQTNANETAKISEEVSQNAERGVDAISKTLSAINQIKHSSQMAVEVIVNLGQKIETIGQILNVIDDVAEQTNLLALNAAIIAAQAGEHGKGFAVVADEIKELAERSGVSTKEIANLIKTIQSESRNAISAVEQGNANVDQGVKVSVDAEKALKQILESAKKSTNMMRSIARATEEQARGSKQVTDTINQIAETVQQIAVATSEQAYGAELIINGAEKMRSITQHVERSTQEQAKGGRQISESIESMSQMVSQLNQSHNKQHQGVEQVVDLFSRVDTISRDQSGNLENLKNLLGEFKKLAEKID